MRCVILESPFAGNVERNIAYAKLCVRDCLLRGEAPIASHLLFTQPGLLDDTQPEQRKLGITAGHAWMNRADFVVVYTDFGMSKGMDAGVCEAFRVGAEVIFRQLDPVLIQSLEIAYPDEVKGK